MLEFFRDACCFNSGKGEEAKESRGMILGKPKQKKKMVEASTNSHNFPNIIINGNEEEKKEAIENSNELLKASGLLDESAMGISKENQQKHSLMIDSSFSESKQRDASIEEIIEEDEIKSSSSQENLSEKKFIASRSKVPHILSMDNRQLEDLSEKNENPVFHSSQHEDPKNMKRSITETPNLNRLSAQSFKIRIPEKHPLASGPKIIIVNKIRRVAQPRRNTYQQTSKAKIDKDYKE